MDGKLKETHRRADGRPLGRRLGWILLLVGLGLAAYLLLGSKNSIFELRELREEKTELLERRREAERSLERYRELLERLETDDAFLEELVRERLGLAAPGERVYVIIDKTSTDGEKAEGADAADPAGGD